MFTALQMTQTLGYLDTAQQEINSSLNSHGDMLKQVLYVTIDWYLTPTLAVFQLYCGVIKFYINYKLKTVNYRRL